MKIGFILNLLSSFLLNTNASNNNIYCNITRSQVQEETRIFAVHSANGTHSLLRHDVVLAGTALDMICDSADEVIIVCKHNGQFDKNLPIQNCKSPTKATVETISDTTCPNGYQAYRVGYGVNNEFFEVYRTCYSVSRLNAQWAKHRVYNHTLVTDRPKTIAFTQDGIISGADAATFRAESVYRRFELLLGPNQQYITSARQIVIDRGHLAPSADYLFVNNMRATFKYINVMPQFSSINHGNWKTIEGFVRTLSRRSDNVGEVFVTTGSLDVLSLHNKNGQLVPMYLATQNRNPLPAWIFKIIESKRTRIVFLTYNNVYAQKPPGAPYYCKEIACGMQFRNTSAAGYTYCCEVNYFANYLEMRPKIIYN